MKLIILEPIGDDSYRTDCRLENIAGADDIEKYVHVQGRTATIITFKLKRKYYACVYSKYASDENRPLNGAASAFCGTAVFGTALISRAYPSGFKPRFGEVSPSDLYEIKNIEYEVKEV